VWVAAVYNSFKSSPRSKNPKKFNQGISEATAVWKQHNHQKGLSGRTSFRLKYGTWRCLADTSSHVCLLRAVISRHIFPSAVSSKERGPPTRRPERAHHTSTYLGCRGNSWKTCGWLPLQILLLWLFT